MTGATSKYSVYMLRGLPPGLFGETYVVVTGVQSPSFDYRAEYFLLAQRPQESLHIGFYEFSAANFPESLATIDVEFSLQEALQQAESYLFDRLEERALQLQRPELSLLQVELKQCAGNLLSCWMRGRFKQQLVQIRDATKCQPLKSYLGLLSQVSITWHAG